MIYHVSYSLYILGIDMSGISCFQIIKKFYDRYPNATAIFCANHEDLAFDPFKRTHFTSSEETPFKRS